LNRTLTVPRLARWLARLEPGLPWLVLAGMLALTYARFAVIPYAGLFFTPSGRVAEVYVAEPAAEPLWVDDQLIQVGPVRWEDFAHDLRQQLFVGVRPGEIVPIAVERDGQATTVAWAFPGFTTAEFLQRLNSEWPLAYLVWAAGAATALFVRPRDRLQRLLLAFNFLTATWLIAGSTVSRWHLWEGAILLRSAVWLSAPVYLHLHWVFPKPLGRLPRWLVWGAYLAAGAMALLEWLQRPPTNLYLMAFLPAVAGSLVLLILHFLRQPDQRRTLALLVVLWAAALLPVVVLVFVSISEVPAFGGGALLGLPALPLAYLYTAYRRRFGAHEVRANRLVALYLFVMLWVAVLGAAVPAANWALPGSGAVIGFTVGLTAVVVSVLGFPRYQRWVERRVLGITWPAAQLLERYSERITTSLETKRLVGLLTGEILPSLLIRQSALVRIDAGRQSVVYLQGVAESELPSEAEMPALAAGAGQLRPDEDPARPCPWALLVLPLRVKEELVGLWLLGRRDPDDHYGAAEIGLLRTLAHQLAVALTNIVNAGRLQALYQNAIDQREAERKSLSRELHDNTLQQLYALKRSVLEGLDSPTFERDFGMVVEGLTQTIRGLRPPMLEYGLYRAIVALADEWSHRPDVLAAAEPVTVEVKLTESDERYPHPVEEHIYRIVQQAGENALKHARARRLVISGALALGRVDLTIEDDGLGFDPATSLDPGALEAQGHFGLAGMRERAALLGGRIAFDSAPGRGARVRLTWEQASGD
jgi:signal transduction histidine kinase